MKSNFFSTAIMKTSVIGTEFRNRYLSNPKHPNVFIAKAVVFEGPEDYHKRLNNKKLKIDENSISYESTISISSADKLDLILSGTLVKFIASSDSCFHSAQTPNVSDGVENPITYIVASVLPCSSYSLHI